MEHRSASEADEAEAFKKVVEQTASAEAILAVHNAQNPGAKMTSISLNGSVGRIDEPAQYMHPVPIQKAPIMQDQKQLDSLDFLTSAAAMAAQERTPSDHSHMMS